MPANVIKFLLLLHCLFLVQSVGSADTNKNVHFPKGQSHASLEGSIVGYGLHNYILNAREGQTVKVTVNQLKGSGIQFRLFFKTDESTVFSSMLDGGPTLSGILLKSGNYVLSIGVNRAQARMKEFNSYRADIEIIN